MQSESSGADDRDEGKSGQMKYHDILGIRENATPQKIDAAYTEKETLLVRQREELGEKAFSTKKREIDKAKADCLVWLELPHAERLKRRAAEYAKAAPNRTNGVVFGVCTGIDALCGNVCNGCGSRDSEGCCEDACGCGGVPIAIDAIAWTAVAILLIVKISQGIFRISRRWRIRRYNNAVTEKPHLESQIASIRSSADRKIQEQRSKETRQRELNIYADFFESIGSASTSEVRAQESARVEKQKDEVARTEQNINDLNARLEKVNEIIRQGRP